MHADPAGRMRRRHPLWTAAVLALVVIATTAGMGAAGGFAPGTTTNFTTVSFPRAIATGDVNNDGILDMVVPSSTGAGISVFRGLGGGAFAPPQNRSANATGVVALADFNLDGKLDIVVPLPALDALQFYNGVGDGTFTSGSVQSTPDAAEVVVTADFNGDGKADVATCGGSGASSAVRVFLNTTVSIGGLVQFSVTDVTVAGQPRGIAVGKNLFGTNTFDLVTANLSAGSITLLKNNGAGVFGNRQDVATKTSCSSVAVGRMWIGENRPQIFATIRDSAQIAMIAYNTNTSAWVKQYHATAADPRHVSIGDADGDQNLDLVVSAYTSNTVSVLSPRFDGTSTWLNPRVDIAVGTNPTGAQVVNLDGDMKPDLLVADRGNSRVSWIQGAPKVGWALGDTIPAFSAQNQYGETFASSALAGKWTLLDFCSNWCSPCRLMAQTTQQSWLKWYRHPSVAFEYLTMLTDGNVAGISSTRQDAIDWAREYGIFRPVLHSSDLPGAGVKACTQGAETAATPTLRLIDPAGRVVWLNLGAVEDTTIARVVANAAGVEIPLTQSAEFGWGTQTVTYGAQQASCESDPSSGFTWPYFISGFGENFASNLDMTRHLNTFTEDWFVTFIYYPGDYPGGTYTSLPTANSWQFTLSDMHLDTGTRILPPGATATVFAQDTDGIDHSVGTVPVTWAGGTMTFGAIPAASLAALPPIRALGLAVTMQLDGWVAGVGEEAPVTELAMRTPSPNPARSASRIAWAQPRAGHARLDVYDVGGRHVRTLADGFQAAGSHAQTWNLADGSGARVGAGLYFLRLAVEGEPARTQRITVVR